MRVSTLAIGICLNFLTGAGAFAQAYDACPNLPPPTRHGMSPFSSNCGTKDHYKLRCQYCVTGSPLVCNGYSSQCCSRYSQACMDGNTR
jgi:hypothetical protein